MTSILPDHAVCQPIDPTLSAVELLELVDDHCDPTLVDQVESEIDKGSAGAGSIEAWLDGFYATIRPTASSVEYLDLLEAETDSFASPPARIRFTGVPELTETDLLEMELDRVVVSTSSFEDLLADIYTRGRSTGSVEYLELLEVETDLFIRPSASPVERDALSQAFLDYHDPRSPWADPE